VLLVLFSPTAVLFSGKLSCTALAGQWRASPEEAVPLVQTPVYKCLKYRAYYATVGFGTAAAAHPHWANHAERTHRLTKSGAGAGDPLGCPARAGACVEAEANTRSGSPERLSGAPLGEQGGPPSHRTAASSRIRRQGAIGLLRAQARGRARGRDHRTRRSRPLSSSPHSLWARR
jgi:hypothetical protein